MLCLEQQVKEARDRRRRLHAVDDAWSSQIKVGLQADGRGVTAILKPHHGSLQATALVLLADEVAEVVLSPNCLHALISLKKNRSLL